MELLDFFRGYVEVEESPVVICDLSHTIIFMNRFSIKEYEQHGGADLVGRYLPSIFNEEVKSKVAVVVEWFKENKNNNRIFVKHDEKDNKDIYMVAIRNPNGELIGYGCRHEYRNPEKSTRYDLD